MEEIIDEELLTAQQGYSEKEIRQKSYLYLGIMTFLPMLIVFVITLVLGTTLSAPILFPFLWTLQFLFLGLLTEAVKKWIRKKKYHNPFWFEVIESAFSIWLIFVAILILIGIFSGIRHYSI